MTSDMLIGRSKVAAALDVIRRSNPWTEVIGLHADLREIRPGALAGLDALVLALDSLEARYLGVRLGHAARVPVLDMGTRADLRTVRVSSSAPGGPCLCCSWGEDQLARAGEVTSAPCAAIDTPAPFSATLPCAQAVGALAADHLLTLIGAQGEPPQLGTELRLDLHRSRLDRFTLPQNAHCAADHLLATTPRQELREDTSAVSLGALMSQLDVRVGAILTFATTVLIEAAVCSGCAQLTRPLSAGHEPLAACTTCGAPATPLRRVRRVIWSDVAAVVATRPAAAWLPPGEVFLVADERRARAFSIPTPPPQAQPGRPWDDRLDAPRFARLPATFDLTAIRAARVGLFGLGHAGGALLHAIGALPWAAILLLDRDTFELPNLAVHSFGALAHREENPNA